MRIITRHLLAQLGAALLLGLLLLVGLVWALQALRLGHHLALGGAPLGRLLLWSAPTLLVFALPLALAAAVLLTFGRLAETNQLLALRAAGASPLQLATPALLLSVLAGLAAGLTALELEPPALRALRVTAGEVAARALHVEAARDRRGDRRSWRVRLGRGAALARHHAALGDPIHRCTHRPGFRSPETTRRPEGRRVAVPCAA